MRKLLPLAAALALASPALAEFLHVSAYGGYTMISFKEVNDGYDKLAKEVNNAGGKASFTPVGSGWLGGVDLNFAVAPFLKIGARLEYDQANDFEISTEAGPVRSRIKGSPSLGSGLLGLTLGTSLPLTGLSLSGAVHGGYGYAAIPFTMTVNSVQTAAGLYVGGGFVGEGSAKLRYELLSLVGLALTLDLQGGYRYAVISGMTDGVEKLTDTHERITKGNKKEIPADYSGGFGTLGLTLGF